MNHMTNLFITKTFPDQHMYVIYFFATTDISITGKICTLYKSCALLFITEHSHKHVISFRFFLFFHWKWSASFQLNCDSHAVSFKLTTVWVSGFASHLLTFKSPLNHLLQLTFLNWDSGKTNNCWVHEQNKSPCARSFNPELYLQQMMVLCSPFSCSHT